MNTAILRIQVRIRIKILIFELLCIIVAHYSFCLHHGITAAQEVATICYTTALVSRMYLNLEIRI